MFFKEGKLYRIKKVSEGTGSPKSTIYRNMKLGLFPKPARIGERAVAWRGEDLIDWYESLQETSI